MQPVSKKMLKEMMDEKGFITSSNMNIIRKILLYRGCEDDCREFVWKLCLGYYEGKNTQKERMEWDEKRAKDYEKIKQTWTNIIPEMKENWDEFNKIEEQIKKIGSSGGGSMGGSSVNISGGAITTNDEDYNLAFYAYSQGSAENVSINVTDGTFDGNFALNGAAVTTMATRAV